MTGGGAGGVKRERKRERALELGNILTNNNNDISDNTLQESHSPIASTT